MLESIIGSLRMLGKRSDDDGVDRAHYFLTSNLLIALSMLVSFKQFGGQPVECLLPPKFPGSWEDYAENYCWSQDTYFLHFDEDVPQDEARRMDTKLSYYQWVPFFLLIEAACFRLPSIIWKYLSGHSGVKVYDIVKIAMDDKNVDPECRKVNIQALTTHLQKALKFHRRIQRQNLKPYGCARVLNLPFSSFYVTFVYLLTKTLYLVNVCLQFYALNKFLEADKYNWGGFTAISELLHGVAWQHSGVFPRVTMCDFKVRVMGNLQTYTVQCVLVINIFNEKIFIFLWFWYTILVLLTLASLVYWIIIMILPSISRGFVSRHLELSEMPFDPVGSDSDVRRFVHSYVRSDGIFLLRMISMHSGIIFTTDLVLSLWRSFYGIEEAYRRSISDQGSMQQKPAPIMVQHRLNENKEQSKIKMLRNRLQWQKKRLPPLKVKVEDSKDTGNKDSESDNDDGNKDSEKDRLIKDLTARLNRSLSEAAQKPTAPPPSESQTTTMERRSVSLDTDGNRSGKEQ